MSVRKETAKVRKIIKDRCPTVSVKMGKGTAYGWVDIWSKGIRFTDKEKKCLKSFGFTPGSNAANLLPAERKVFIKTHRVPRDREKYKYW